MENRFKIFYLLLLFCLLNNSVFASRALTILKNNIESRSIELGYLHDTIVNIANTNGLSTSNFEIVHVPGHFIVKNKFSGQIYDSGSGEGGVIRQHFADCLLHSTDNLFYLESFNGKLPYSDFSAKMREDLDITMFYSFIHLYINFMRYSFNNFNLTDLNDILTPCSYYTSSQTLYLKNSSLGKTTIPEILLEAGIVSSNTRDDFINMLRYIFTDMKNKMGLPGVFSFEEDTPHLLWLFRDAIGYSEDQVKGLLGGYLDRYNKILLEISLDYIESILSLYFFQEKNMQNNLSQISRNENSSNFSLDYGNGKIFNNRLNSDLSFSYLGEYEFCKNKKLGLIFGYSQNTFSFEKYNIELKNIFIGGIFKKVYNYDEKSNFNMGIIGNFKINNKDSVITKQDVGLNFNNENITLFFQDYRNFVINSIVLSKINIITTFNYTNYSLRNFKLFNYGLNNFNVSNNRYSLFSLNFELDFVKTFNFSKNIKSNIVLNTRSINYINRSNNGFDIKDADYDFVYSKQDKIMKNINNLWFNFKADIHFGKYIEINGIIGTNVIFKNDTFIGAGIVIRF